MPQHIRGKIHLLAPWIPPSQMVSIGINKEPIPVTTLPYSQRFLRSLPTPLLKAANSPFFAMTSNSLTTSIPKSSRQRAKRRSLEASKSIENNISAVSKPVGRGRRVSVALSGNLNPPPTIAELAATEVGANGAPRTPNSDNNNINKNNNNNNNNRPSTRQGANEDFDRSGEYDARLTTAIWDLATSNANPARDLLICLERTHDIGFRYVDITKEVVIHHGSRDTRVPVDNVRWLGKTMRKCEVRVLEGEGHGLMASAQVMGSVLTEMAGEWTAWERGKGVARKSGAGGQGEGRW
jgi:pimeloyl-ACP methyl ester carboxylesterase